MTKGLQHGSSRKRLEITLITDGDNSSRTRYHSPSPYVLPPTLASCFTIQVKQIKFFITFSSFETKTTIMSTPTTPIISVTDINDETTVIEQPREESPSPIPIPPPQSMSSLNDDSMSPHHSPIVSSDDEADNDSDTAFSRSRTPSPDSTVAILMQFLTDTAEQLAEPIHVINHTMRNVIVTRDRMIHRLSTATEPLTDEQREALIISLKEFALATPPPRSSHATHSLSLRLGSPWYLSSRKEEKNKSSFTQLAHRQLSLYKPTLISLTIPIPTLPTQNLNYR